MRQTSRAVALLLALESAQAQTVVGANTSTKYNGAIYVNPILDGIGGPDNNPTGLLNSRTAPYNPCIQKLTSQRWTQWPVASGNVVNCAAAQWASSTMAGQLLKNADLPNATYDGKITTATTSTCVICIQQLGVWCSRTFNYQELDSVLTYQFNTGTNTLRSMSKAPFTGAMNLQTDNGSCCGATATMTAKMLYTTDGVKKAADSGAIEVPESLIPSGETYNAYACVAFSNVQDGTTKNKLAVPALMNTKPAQYQSWWCSNGLFSQSTGAGGTDYVKNIVAPIPDNANQRMELALVGCPQLGKLCGAVAKTMIDLDTAANAAAMKVNMSADMGYADKCTWIAYATKYNPTFIMGKGNNTTTTSDTLGIYEDATKQTWILHHMEYNGEQLPIASGGYRVTNTQAAPTGGKGLDQYGMVPMFTMGSNLYGKQRTWYGKGTAVYNPSNWSTPYQNAALATVTEYKGGQNYGSVATFASVSYLTAKYDARIVRYLPLQVAINDNTMGKAVATAYGTAKTSYDSAKTTWNNYVAILTKNAKVDAFSAAFAPPKAPTVPPLPNMPWKPDVSATMSQLSSTSTVAGIQWAGFSNFAKSSATTTITSGVQPAANNFWITDDSVPLATGGGWGSFTAAILYYRENWGKSYGTIGYEDSVANTKWNSMGAAYNPRFYCDSASAAGSCQKVYGAATSAAAGSGTGTINATVMYVAISLWSQGVLTANYDFKAVCKLASSQYYSCLSIQWSKGTWNTAMAGLTAPASMTAATAADSLTGIVGAQALAASAAAAFTAAAALY